MKTLLKQTIIWSSVFTLGAGITFAALFDYSSLNKAPISDENQNFEMKPSQALMNSIISLNEAEVKGNVEVTFDNNYLDIALDGQLRLDTSNLANTRFDGDLVIQNNGLKINSSLNYFNNRLFLTYQQSKLYLETESLLSFLEVLPTYGVNLSLPDELTNLNIDYLLETLNSLEPIAINGGYYFNFPLTEEIEIHLMSDQNYSFTGFRTNKFYFDDNYIFLEFAINENKGEPFVFAEPNILEYQSLSPAFNLVDVLYHTFAKENNTLGITLDLNHFDQDYINASIDLSYDTNLTEVYLDGYIDEVMHNNRQHHFSLGYKEDSLLVDYNNLDFRIDGQSIYTLIEYIISKVGDDVLTGVMGSLSETTSSIDLEQILDTISTVNNMIDDIIIKDNLLEIVLNLDQFGVQMDGLTLGVDFTSEKLQSIYLNGLNIDGYLANISIEVKEYSPLVMNKEDYVAIEPALTLVDAYEYLSAQNKFRLEFNGAVTSSLADVNPVTLKGGLQFDLANKYGYGDITLIDQTSYQHSLRVDMRDQENIYLNYNDGLKGHLSGAFFTDLIDVISELFSNEDNALTETINSALGATSSMPIMEAINNQDYGLLFEIGLLDKLDITNEEIILTLNGGILGIDTSFDLVINYNALANDGSEVLRGLEIRDLVIDSSIFNFQITLVEFDESLENNRLDLMDVYYEFDSLILLLRLGLNTAIYDHYQLSGSAYVKAKILLFDIDFNLPISIRIVNDGGSLTAAIDIESIPALKFINNNAPLRTTIISRKASIYYEDGSIYIMRIEEQEKKTGIFITKTEYYTYKEYARTTLNGFFDNALYYFCDLILDFSDTIMNEINKNSGDTSNDTIIKYENILTDYSYNSNSDRPFFNLGINIAELAQDEMFGPLTVKIYVDQENSRLDSLDATISLFIGPITINLGANLALINYGQVVNVDDVKAYALEHQNDELDQTYTSTIQKNV